MHPWFLLPVPTPRLLFLHLPHMQPTTAPCISPYFTSVLPAYYIRSTVVLPTSHPRISLPFHPIVYPFLMYLYHLISIDLQSSRSCNSSHCKSLHHIYIEALRTSLKRQSPHSLSFDPPIDTFLCVPPSISQTHYQLRKTITQSPYS